MTKADIVNELQTPVWTRLPYYYGESFMDVVRNSLANNENVYLRGFGSFIVKKRAQKTARNIQEHYHHYSRAQHTRF